MAINYANNFKKFIFSFKKSFSDVFKRSTSNKKAKLFNKLNRKKSLLSQVASNILPFEIILKQN